MPLTDEHLATLAAFKAAEALIAVDYLQECEATLPEVLLAYAGTSPEFADGLPHEALWEWLHRTEPWWWVNRGVLRWEAVRDTLMGSLSVIMSGQDRKRRVLSLFPDVGLPCPACRGPVKKTWEDLPPGPCRRCLSSAVVAAPDLIAYELPPVRPISELVPPGSPR